MTTFVKRLRGLCLILLVLLFPLCGWAAEDYRNTLEEACKARLLQYGLSSGVASRLAGENAFIGMVMTRGERGGNLKSLHHNAGDALGRVIGSAYLAYGERQLPLAVSAMMNAARAGVPPVVLASAFEAMAQNNYAIKDAVALVHAVSETTLTAALRDKGVGLCKSIQDAAKNHKPYRDLQKQIVLAARLQDTLTKQALLAKKAAQEKEKVELARRSRGGGERGGGSGKGGLASGGRGGNDSRGKSGGSSANDSGGNSGGGSGNDSGGNSGGGSGNDSGGNSGGGSGNDSGGNSGGGSGNDSGGNSGGGSGNDSGGNSGGGSGNDSGGNSGGGSGNDSGGNSGGGSGNDSGGNSGGGSGNDSGGNSGGGSGNDSGGNSDNGERNEK